MSRPSDVGTKTISVRIPMPQYISLLNEAYAHKMSISDLLVLRIFGHESDSDKTKPKAEKTKPITEFDKPNAESTFRPKKVFEGSKEDLKGVLRANKAEYGFQLQDIDDIKLWSRKTSEKRPYEIVYERQGHIILRRIKDI